MDHQRTGRLLTVRCLRDFNLMAVRHLTYRLHDATDIRIDLSHARLVDTEAVMALDALHREGHSITLVNPPPLFDDVLDVLGLRDHFDGALRIERHRTPDGSPA